MMSHFQKWPSHKKKKGSILNLMFVILGCINKLASRRLMNIDKLTSDKAN